jgi:hypothetical protein
VTVQAHWYQNLVNARLGFQPPTPSNHALSDCDYDQTAESITQSHSLWLKVDSHSVRMLCSVCSMSGPICRRDGFDGAA